MNSKLLSILTICLMIFSTVGAVAAADSNIKGHGGNPLGIEPPGYTHFENPTSGIIDNGGCFSVTLIMSGTFL